MAVDRSIIAGKPYVTRKARWRLLIDISSSPFGLVMHMPDGLFGAGVG